MDDKKQPIIVKKIIKGGHGHHGGAWKVAMADFAIAMMAFFMVMWLLGGTTVEQKAAISSYFKNPSLSEGISHVAAQGQMGPGGASTSMIKLGGTMELPKGEGQRALEKSNNQNGDPHNTGRKIRKETLNTNLQGRISVPISKEYRKITKSIKKAFDKKTLRRFKKQLLIDVVDEGLRIQLVDRAKRPMFASGKSTLQTYAAKMLNKIGMIINRAKTKISITGHTDGKPYTDRIDYTNWELSSDRANAARRALLDGGLKIKLVARVVGLGSSMLLDKKKPLNPVNRRISIVILNAKALAVLKRLEASQARALARWYGNKIPKKKLKKKLKKKIELKKKIKLKEVDPKNPPHEIIPPNRLPTNDASSRMKEHVKDSKKKTNHQPKPNTHKKAGSNDKKPAMTPKTKSGNSPKLAPDTRIPAKYRGKPAVRAAPRSELSGFQLPMMVDPP